MKTTNEYIHLLRDYKRQHAAKYGIVRMGIFGSVARGEQTDDSDVDVI
jgi:predicted nucleotidyltransferase